MSECCENCRFYDMVNKAEDDFAGSGECRRSPPVFSPAYLASERQLNRDAYETRLVDCDPRAWRFPMVHGDDWCGEYQQKQEATDDR